VVSAGRPDRGDDGIIRASRVASWTWSSRADL